MMMAVLVAVVCGTNVDIRIVVKYRKEAGGELCGDFIALGDLVEEGRPK